MSECEGEVGGGKGQREVEGEWRVEKEEEGKLWLPSSFWPPLARLASISMVLLLHLQSLSEVAFVATCRSLALVY